MHGTLGVRGDRRAACGRSGRSTTRTGAFAEAQALCERDGGRLWGVSICAPMVIGDARTQTFATSQPPPDAPRPKIIGLLNGPIQWGDRTWAAVSWDTIANWPARTRGELLLHESFHIVQPQLVPNGPAGANEHLDAVDGRYWLRLEWRALARALRERGDLRTQAVRDALAFRQAHTRYPDKVESERVLYILEGLASYTRRCWLRHPRPTRSRAGSSSGGRGGRGKLRAHVHIQLRAGVWPAARCRVSRLAANGARQRRSASHVDACARGPTGRGRAAAAARYGGAELRAAEEQREQQRQARIAGLRQRFVDGPVFVMPCGGGGTRNSLGAVVIPGAGTVLQCLSPVRLCGTLTAENGVLEATDGGSRRLPAPVRGDDVTISETGGHSGPRRAGSCAKARAGATTKPCASSRE